jgi:UPF0755 protein
MNKGGKNILAILMLVILIGSFFYIKNKTYFASGVANSIKTISIENGDNALVVGEKLSKAGIISGKYYFAWYLWLNNKLHSIVAGVYEFPKGMPIPEAALIVTGGETVPMRVKVTFPEGWTMKKYAERLNASGLSGDDFLKIAEKPDKILKGQYEFLDNVPADATLEGFLFPDTYYFSNQATGEEIVKKMLDTFSLKVFNIIYEDVKSQNKSFYDVMIMGSIVEGEVRNASDRKTVSGLFWNRIASGMLLQSDATLEYALGTNKFQHSISETKIDSPYNSYQNKGLPPGPVSNPGLASIQAALHPNQTDYVYFLSDPKTGKTVFAKTYEQHLANKAQYGL